MSSRPVHNLPVLCHDSDSSACIPWPYNHGRAATRKKINFLKHSFHFIYYIHLQSEKNTIKKQYWKDKEIRFQYRSRLIYSRILSFWALDLEKVDAPKLRCDVSTRRVWSHTSWSNIKNKVEKILCSSGVSFYIFTFFFLVQKMLRNYTCMLQNNIYCNKV